LKFLVPFCASDFYFRPSLSCGLDLLPARRNALLFFFPCLPPFSQSSRPLSCVPLFVLLADRLQVRMPLPCKTCSTPARPLFLPVFRLSCPVSREIDLPAPYLLPPAPNFCRVLRLLLSIKTVCPLPPSPPPICRSSPIFSHPCSTICESERLVSSIFLPSGIHSPLLSPCFLELPCLRGLLPCPLRPLA